MRSLLSKIFTLAVFMLIIVSCQKGKEVDQGSYMKLNLAVYHPDTSVYSQVTINGDRLTDAQGFGTDANLYNLFLQKNWTLFQDSARLQVRLTKTTAGDSLNIDDTIRFSNANDLILFQTCPGTDPILIDRKIGEASEIPIPTGDSVRVRFFFSTNDKIANPNAGYVGRLLSRMRLQLYTFTPNANPNLPPAASSFVLVNNAVDFNSCGLSEYVTLARNKNYGFRLRDISPGIPGSAAANLVQQLLPDNDIMVVTNPFTGNQEWDFKRGKIFISPATDNKYQTIRIKFSTISFTDRNGNDTNETAINGQFILGLNKN